TVSCLPPYNPLGPAPPAPRGGPGYELCCLYAGRMMSMKSLLQLEMVGARFEQGRPGKERPFTALVLFFARFLASPLACERSLNALFLAGLQIKGVALDFLDNFS